MVIIRRLSTTLYTNGSQELTCHLQSSSPSELNETPVKIVGEGTRRKKQMRPTE